MGARLTIGELAERSGAATSALRFYEARGLLSSERTSGGHRVYPRSTLRRVAFVRAAQRCGLTLGEIREALDTLPSARTPTTADWGRLSRALESRRWPSGTSMSRPRSDGAAWSRDTGWARPAG